MRKKLVYKNLSKLFKTAFALDISDKDKFVIFSDLHMGNGGYNDDFIKNADLFMYVIKHYYQKKNYSLILNGDIEELYKFSLKKIEKKWNKAYQIFNVFNKKNKLFKTVGNHDYKLFFKKLIKSRQLSEAIKLNYNNNIIFIFHGHQADIFLGRHNWFVPFVLRYIASPLFIKSYEVSPNKIKKYKIEKNVYEFSCNKKIISVIGHTHRPLFESFSKIDSLRFRIEQLCRYYPNANKKEKNIIESSVKKFKQELLHYYTKKNIKEASRSSLYNENIHVPSLFNSGCVIGKSGITAIEIDNGYIRLAHWFDKRRRDKYLKLEDHSPERLEGSNFYRVILNQEILNYIFTRIRLLA